MTDNTNIEALLPCPFCGSDDVHLQEPEQIEAISWIGYVTCHECDAQVSDQFSSDSIIGAKIFAAATWNRRAALSNAEPVGYLLEWAGLEDAICKELVFDKPDEQSVNNYDRIDPVFLHPSVPAPQWLPIESAPNDGKHILLKTNGYSKVRVGWFYNNAWQWDGHYEGVHYGKPPTHWMHLPLANIDEKM